MITIPQHHTSQVSARCRADDLMTRVRVLFDYDHASRDHRQAAELIAQHAENRHGRKDAELDAGTLANARSAVSLGQRWLSYYSRPLYQGSAIVPSYYDTLLPGDEINLGHPQLPITHWLVTDVVAPPASQFIQLSLEGVAGNVLPVTLLRLSNRFEPVQLEPATVVTQADIAEFTLRDPDGQPLAQARVTMDGQITLLTDNNGFVQFTGVTPGPHTLLVEANGLQPMQFEWVQG